MTDAPAEAGWWWDDKIVSWAPSQIPAVMRDPLLFQSFFFLLCSFLLLFSPALLHLSPPLLSNNNNNNNWIEEIKKAASLTARRSLPVSVIVPSMMRATSVDVYFLLSPTCRWLQSMGFQLFQSLLGYLIKFLFFLLRRWCWGIGSVRHIGSPPFSFFFSVFLSLSLLWVFSFCIVRYAERARTDQYELFNGRAASTASSASA